MLPPLPTFDDYFYALWQHPPYPWQRRLAARVTEGGWPDAIGVPTGTGKTSTIDVALYALAAEAELDPAARRQPRRIVVVVDRRTIVDQAYDRAVLIRERLKQAEGGPLLAVRARLLSLMGRDADREDPLAIALLRGGIPRDDGWARRPDQPLVAVSTVDQVGSRLLFRGYGVRPTMQSVHAGLLGNDALLLLDEVHLSRPFEETLDALQGRWRGWHDGELPDRWRFVRLSATSGVADAFGLDQHDRDDEHLKTRLHASKHVRCARVDAATHKGKPAAPSKAWVDALVREARELVAQGRRCVGVVVNRVDTARAVHDALSGRRDLRATLLTGRMRPCDRADVVAEVARRAGPDRAPDANADQPYVCVSTQCIEAGADLDFDGLVTELASLDALVQRFGRVNRTGRRPDAPIVILAPKGIDDDPIYGTSLAPTLAWLDLQGEVFDASTAGLAARVDTAPPETRPPCAKAAVLLPAHLDLLAQTAPIPDPHPDPGLYLHGLDRPRPEVRIVWRADVDLEHEEQAKARLEAVPPTTFEALSLPLAAARRWLDGEAVGSFGDAGPPAEPDQVPRRGKRPYIGLMADKEGWRLATIKDLRPEAVIVVPAGRGGLRAGNFDPAATDPVSDHGDLGVTLRTGRPTARLDLRVYGARSEPDAELRWPGAMTAPPPVPVDRERTSLVEARREVKAWLGAAGPDLPPVLRELAERAARVGITAVDGTWVLSGAPLPRGRVLELSRGQEERGDAALSGDDDSTSTGAEVSLRVHLEGVEAWAESLATACGLPTHLVADLSRAGRWHDLGKADPRFQVMLYGGDEIRAAGGEPLAKSKTTPADRLARRRAAEAARLPRGFRHEMASVALLQSSDAGRSLLEACHDPELVLHLVASHHGHARPFAPAEDHRGQPEDLVVRASVYDSELAAPGDHGLDALDSGVADRFFRLQRRYGWWGLAWLEALLRLADHRESEAETRASEDNA